MTCRDGKGGAGDAAFTMVELLIVIGIIGLLAGILLPAVAAVRARAQVAEITTMVRDLDMQIENFKFDYNQYPWEPPPEGPEDPDAADVIRELCPTDERLTKGNAPEYNKQWKTYLDLSDKYIRDVGDGTCTLVDLWGQEYHFHLDRESNRIWIYSLGPDGEDDTIDGDDEYGDDINNL